MLVPANLNPHAKLIFKYPNVAINNILQEIPSIMRQKKALELSREYLAHIQMKRKMNLRL